VSFPEIPISTEYTEEEIHGLFFDDYSCPFCGNRLKFTSVMIDLLLPLLKKRYHIGLNQSYIEISNGKVTFFLDNNKEITDVKPYLMGMGIEEDRLTGDLPTVSDLKDINKLIADVNLNKWKVLIESGAVSTSFVSTYDLWLGDI